MSCALRVFAKSNTGLVEVGSSATFLVSKLPGGPGIGYSTTSPDSRFSRGVGPYVLVDGTIVANNWSDLTSGTLRHAIDETETGRPPPTTTCVRGWRV